MQLALNRLWWYSSDIVRAGLEPHRAAIEAQAVRVEVNVPEDLEVHIARSRVERVIENLVANALEAMPGGGTLRITASGRSGHALLELADSGPGVPAEIAERLFQPFVTAGKKDGLGLGLALSRQTMLDHRGDLWLASGPGESATFRLRLPLTLKAGNP